MKTWHRRILGCDGALLIETAAAAHGVAALTAVVIPTIGAPELESCLAALADLDPPPARVLVVSSGGAAPSLHHARCEVIHEPRQLGFAAAVNIGLRHVMEDHDFVALLNDDASPGRRWLHTLHAGLQNHPQVAAVQGTVTDTAGGLVDGRGIALDRWGLPVQIDRGVAASPEEGRVKNLLAVSATAAVYRSRALAQVALGDGTIFDESFGSYHEDLDLGLRLDRMGWEARWIADAPCRHQGSASGAALSWRHPWWVLGNRWRALAANLRPLALVRSLPRLLRGEVRAVRTLARDNPRTFLVAAAVWCTLPAVIAGGWRRISPGPRLASIPEGTA